tara:strand:+ start:537 stop:1079 length:543 start_codon:yes stop_codon:yes gene_type:complete
MVNRIKAVFLDRDGVLVRSKIKDRKAYAPTTFKGLKIYKDSYNCIRKLKSLGFKTIVVTNQPDVEKKIIAKKTLNKMHLYLKKKTKIQKIYTCIHTKDKNCDCRKPKSGMLIKAAKQDKIDLKKSYMIGDRYSDIICGRRAGCKTIFIDRNYKEKKPKIQNVSVRNLKEATSYIQRHETR